jgi:hypothetical protein
MRNKEGYGNNKYLPATGCDEKQMVAILLSQFFPISINAIRMDLFG